MPLRVIILCVTLLGTAPIQAAVIRRVAGPGDQAPEVAGASFERVGYPEFDTAGNVRFWGRTVGPQISFENSEGFWHESNRQLQLVTRMTAPLPGGTAGETIKQWAAFGDGLALISLSGPHVDATSDTALLDLRSRTARTIARDGQSVSTMLPDTRFSYVDYGRADLSEKNTIFRGVVTGPGTSVENDGGLWIDNGNSIREVVREGDLAPGLLVPFREFTGESVDRFGRAVFFGRLDGVDPLTSRFERGAYAERDGEITELLRTGAQAPGLEAGTSIASIYYPRIAENGHVAFHVDLSGPDIGHSNDRAIYGDRGKGVELLAREGDSVPGLPEVIWNGIEGRFSLQRNALLSISNEAHVEWELFETGWQRVKPMLRAGEAAPGTASTFADIGPYSRPNSSGRRAYLAQLQDDDKNWENDEGIWAEDQNGVLQLVIRDGDLIETRPGRFEPVNFDDLYSDLHGFNDRGEVLFTAHGGVYVATVNAVPEPTTLVIALVGVIVAIVSQLRRQRRA